MLFLEPDKLQQVNLTKFIPHLGGNRPEFQMARTLQAALIFWVIPVLFWIIYTLISTYYEYDGIMRSNRSIHEFSLAREITSNEMSFRNPKNKLQRCLDKLLKGKPNPDDILIKLIAEDLSMLRSLHQYTNNSRIQSFRIKSNSHEHNQTVTSSLQQINIELPCISESQLFTWLTSVDGFSLIDPITPRVEHEAPPLYSRPLKHEQYFEIRRIVVNISLISR